MPSIKCKLLRSSKMTMNTMQDFLICVGPTISRYQKFLRGASVVWLKVFLLTYTVAQDLLTFVRIMSQIV